MSDPDFSLDSGSEEFGGSQIATSDVSEEYSLGREVSQSDNRGRQTRAMAQRQQAIDYVEGNEEESVEAPRRHGYRRQGPVILESDSDSDIDSGYTAYEATTSPEPQGPRRGGKRPVYLIDRNGHFRPEQERYYPDLKSPEASEDWWGNLHPILTQQSPPATAEHTRGETSPPDNVDLDRLHEAVNAALESDINKEEEMNTHTSHSRNTSEPDPSSDLFKLLFFVNTSGDTEMRQEAVLYFEQDPEGLVNSETWILDAYWRAKPKHNGVNVLAQFNASQQILALLSGQLQPKAAPERRCPRVSGLFSVTQRPWMPDKYFGRTENEPPHFFLNEKSEIEMTQRALKKFKAVKPFNVEIAEPWLRKAYVTASMRGSKPVLKVATKPGKNEVTEISRLHTNESIYLDCGGGRQPPPGKNWRAVWCAQEQSAVGEQNDTNSDDIMDEGASDQESHPVSPTTAGQEPGAVTEGRKRKKRRATGKYSHFYKLPLGALRILGGEKVNKMVPTQEERPFHELKSRAPPPNLNLRLIPFDLSVEEILKVLPLSVIKCEEVAYRLWAAGWGPSDVRRYIKDHRKLSYNHEIDQNNVAAWMRRAYESYHSTGPQYNSAEAEKLRKPVQNLTFQNVDIGRSKAKVENQEPFNYYVEDLADGLDDEELPGGDGEWTLTKVIKYVREAKSKGGEEKDTAENLTLNGLKDYANERSLDVTTPDWDRNNEEEHPDAIALKEYLRTLDDDIKKRRNPKKRKAGADDQDYLDEEKVTKKSKFGMPEKRNIDDDEEERVEEELENE